jgi:hypothetical protein
MPGPIGDFEGGSLASADTLAMGIELIREVPGVQMKVGIHDPAVVWCWRPSLEIVALRATDMKRSRATQPGRAEARQCKANSSGDSHLVTGKENPSSRIESKRE